MDEMDTWPTLAAMQYEQTKKRVPVWQIIAIVLFMALLLGDMWLVLTMPSFMVR